MSRCFRWRHNLRQSWWYRWRDHHHLVAPNDTPTNFNFPQDTSLYPKALFWDTPLYPREPTIPDGRTSHYRNPTIPEDISPLDPQRHSTIS